MSLEDMKLTCHKCGRVFVPSQDTMEALEHNGAEFDFHIKHCRKVIEE